ncbi:hypothetical protein E1091_03045, partial [Micromonospora fluostatini]
MTPSQDKVAVLRATLAGLSGPARMPSLLALTAALFERAGRSGLGNPTGTADLDAAILVIEEAYGHLGPDDQLRGLVANKAGMLLGSRFLLVPGRDDQDRVRAVSFLEESLGSAHLPPEPEAVGCLMLSQLHLIRVGQGLDSVDMSTALRGGGVAPEYLVEADRAVARAKQLAEAPVVTADLSNIARFVLKAAEMARDQIQAMNGGVGGLDQGLLRRLSTAIQEYEAQPVDGMAGFPGGGGGPPVPPQQLLDLAMAATFGESPLDQPAVVKHGPEPAAPPRASAPPPAAVPVDVERLRAALAAQFAQMAAATRDSAPPAAEPAEAYRAAAALLRPDGPPLPVDAVDECVALATAVVHELEATDPAGAGVDRFLLAVALF